MKLLAVLVTLFALISIAQLAIATSITPVSEPPHVVITPVSEPPHVVWPEPLEWPVYEWPAPLNLSDPNDYAQCPLSLSDPFKQYYYNEGENAVPKYTQSELPPPGVISDKTADLMALKKGLDDSSIIIYAGQKDGHQMYQKASKDRVRYNENKWDESERWAISGWKTAKVAISLDSNFFLRYLLAGCAIATGGFANTYQDKLGEYDKYLKSSGLQNSIYSEMYNFSKNLSDTLSEQEKAKIIYDMLQSKILSNVDIDSYSMAQVLEKGEGVCRHKAVLLADLLEASGINSYAIISPTHAWTRVKYANGSIVDLDPMNYITYFEVSPRTVSQSQILDIRNN